MGRNTKSLFGLSKRDKSGGTNQEKLLKDKDMKLMENYLNSVDEFLKLKNNDKLSESVKKCFGTWAGLFPLREKNDRAEIVLSAYYQSEKIRDTLIKLRDFVERMDTVDCDETAREMGYYNYIFFLERDMKDMRKKYEGSDLRQELLELTPDNVAWFIQEECSEIAPIKDLPEVRTAARRMLDLAEVGKKPPKRFRDIISAISTALELLKTGNKDKASTDLEELNNLLTERKETLEKNIKKGEDLYKDLIESKIDTWSQKFNPKEEPVRNMTREKVKAFYHEECRDALQLLEKEKG